MIFVKIEKRRLEILINAFCIKHDISLPNYDDSFSNSGRLRHKVVNYTILHHIMWMCFIKSLIDSYKNFDHFNEVTSDILNGAACLNSIDSFSSFDIKKKRL
ncbi:hypothetical protein H5410_047547 [Solanum commersonii]|uniref:Uncharacterized protein n=1 Tax=Solanum commersonii TaxID=4109 RepID=A0A9J5XFF5_SOLCO|nr:hypothetical protein H5410_047547 [Solanum commersonii]